MENIVFPEQHLPLPIWRRQALVLWLSQAFRLIGVLWFLLAGLYATSQPFATTPTASQIDATIDQGRTLRAHGEFELAIQKFEVAARSADQIGDLSREALALALSSGCEQSLFRYSQAIEHAQASRKLAIQAHDDTMAGAATLNLCSVYRGLGDLDLAEKESDYSIHKLANSPRRDYLVKSYLNDAVVQKLINHHERALQSAQTAVSVAQQAHLTLLEGIAWDFSGLLLLNTEKLPEAQRALDKAVEVQTQIHDADDLAVTHEHLAELELKKGNYAAALKYIDEAFAANTPAFKINAQYYPVHVRAQILLGLGRTTEALSEFKRAVDLASEWRSGALPGDVTSTYTVAELHGIYQDYAELAATLALKNHNAALGRSALEAIADNRAASLREQLALTLGRNKRLPPEYFELISALEKEQAQVTLAGKSSEHEAKLREIRVQLSDLENKIGIQELGNLPRLEKNPHKNSLRSIQGRLTANEVLLSFCLGQERSFGWAVTRDDVNLYQLPDENAIAAQAKAFTDAAHAGTDLSVSGFALSRSLFGQLGPAVLAKRDWLLTLDGELLDGIPFSALPDPRKRTETLSFTHSLRLLPSELLLLQPNNPAPAPIFVGIADPIYNRADSRRGKNVPLIPAKATRAVGLARLVGSQSEVEAGAKTSGIPQAELLTGANASGKSLRKATEVRPEVLHFAVHVVSPPEQPQEAALALSLTEDGLPELLTPEAISTYSVPGSLVVMSGCASEQGKTLPSAGLIGLSRAWLMAGAEAVVVSAWPTPDDSGRFFSSFYAHLQKHSGPLAKRASVALEEAQQDMQRGGGFRSSPSFWAAYSIVSKE